MGILHGMEDSKWEFSTHPRQVEKHCSKPWFHFIVYILCILTLTVLVMTIDALGHFETG